ncbi:urate hydroxylase PuuD [Roseococcus sp. DSY-14]|uniref:urate hydroxylase PuuD n=1 Tax=Roseococcus sp. DSY-14 TaxID=3369650 RepID=UPI00387B6831
MDAAYLWEWASLLLRWLHVITAIAWIGASFYFIALDNSLEAPKDGDPLVRGEQWSLHGGGFYYKKKFKGAPPAMPATLHWFKWEAYWTWISGFALFALLYWGRAETYLIDPEVADISVWTAVAASIAIIVAGWVVYDQLCKRLWGREGLITALAFLWVSVLGVVATQLFSGRGAFLVIGVTMGTAMAANVAHVIIPGQRRMVKAIEAGQEPDPKDGLAGKQRSVHNTYVTLPVLLMMLSPHYPMLTQGRWNWVSLILLVVAGALIRQFFVLRHSGRSNWALPVGGAVALGALAWLVAPRPDPRFAGVEAPPFAEVQAIVAARCATCHAANPSFDGIGAPPKGVVMETAQQIRRWAQPMRQQVASEAMPPGNLTDITDEERGKILAWVAGGARLD